MGNSVSNVPLPRAQSAEGDVAAALHTMRHSASHLMAAAILQIRPNAKFGVGPSTDNGFYYDVEATPPLGEQDLEDIEGRMRSLKEAHLPIERSELAIDAARTLMEQLDQPYKVELINALAESGTTKVSKEIGDESAIGLTQLGGVTSVTLFKLGDFVDLCRGPHVPDTGKIGAFKLSHISGAYWRGDERRPQLQRIYALCFANQMDLDAELAAQVLRRQRDHRKLGFELEIFAFSKEVGIGLPLWLPNGTTLRKELELLAHECERRGGYQQVNTPEVARGALYYQSGHLPYYKEDMYPPMKLGDEEDLYLRPMNCPHHHHIFLARPRSYREMPLRLAEYGKVFRYEAHGALSGLMRTRGFCQNDAHLYCTYDQAKDEFAKVMRLHSHYYDALGIRDYYMRLSMPDLSRLDKYVDDPERWLKALEIIREAMAECGLPFKEAEGEAAFYGPKVDFMIRSVVGTEYAISTNQLDFLASTRFDLTYAAADGSQQPVYVIHRAPLGSHERFIAFLLEQFGGAFPTWLSPIHARIIPIADRHVPYAMQLKEQLEAEPVRTATIGLRIDVDDSSERMQKKIRNAQEKKIPYMLVVGDKEAAAGAAALRHRSGKDFGSLPVADIVARLAKEIAERRDLPDTAAEAAVS